MHPLLTEAVSIPQAVGTIAIFMTLSFAGREYKKVSIPQAVGTIAILTTSFKAYT